MNVGSWLMVFVLMVPLVAGMLGLAHDAVRAFLRWREDRHVR